MSEPVKVVSNVIELSTEKKYILVFKSEWITMQELINVMAVLREMGIEHIGVALRNGEELEVVEMPGEGKPGRVEVLESRIRSLEKQVSVIQRGLRLGWGENAWIANSYREVTP